MLVYGLLAGAVGLVAALHLLGPLVTWLLLGRWQPADGPRIDGRVAVVTGASTGVGRETALALARLGATVVLGIRSDERGRETEAALRDEIVRGVLRAAPRSTTGGAMAGRVEYMKLDLADLASVRSFAMAVSAKWPRVDILVNNGGLNNTGVPTAQISPTRQGIEEVYGVNYLGHFLLTVLLLPAMRAAAEQNGDGSGAKWRN